MTSAEHDLAPVDRERQDRAPAAATAASAVVQDLHHRFHFALCVVTGAHERDGRQRVLASAGPWAARAAPGAELVAGLLRDGVGLVVDVPLLAADGRLVGTVRAFGVMPPAARCHEVLEQTQVLSVLLGVVLAGEQDLLTRVQDVATARALATRDQLTQLCNRHGWQEAVAVEEQRCRRYDSVASVLVLDLDDLKQANDRDGHAAGDRLLVACSEVLAGTCRPGDVLARLGGDEFAVLALECDVPAARALSARVRRRLLGGGVDASVGCTTRRPDEDLGQTWERADQAMYRAKRHRLALVRAQRPGSRDGGVAVPEPVMPSPSTLR